MSNKQEPQRIITRVSVVNLTDMPGTFDNGQKCFTSKDWTITPNDIAALGPGVRLESERGQVMVIPASNIRSIDYGVKS